jgi:hypothetical protein
VSEVQSRIFKRDLTYTRLSSQEVYAFNKELAPYYGKLLIYFDPVGHVQLVYKNQLFEGDGTPLIKVRLLHGRTTAFTRGLLVVINTLPSDFETRLKAYLADFPRTGTATCVSAVCKAVDGLGLTDVIQGNYTSPTGLLKYFVQLPAEEQNRLGLEFVALGYSMEEGAQVLREREWKAVRDLPGVAVSYAKVGGILTKLIFQLLFARR